MKQWEFRALRQELHQQAAKSDQEFRNAMADLDARIENSRHELFNLRFQLATRQLKNHQRLDLVRHEVAKLETLRRELEIETWTAEEATA